MKMLANNVLIRPEPWTTVKQGSIIMPDTVKDKFTKGVVVAVGPGLWLSATGKQCPIEVDVGDHVMYFKASAVEVIVASKDMHVVQEREIISILEDGDYELPKTVNEGDEDASSGPSRIIQG